MVDDKIEDEPVIDAIRVVQQHLREAWIVEGCRTHQVWGCASCQAAQLDRDLEILATEILPNAGI